MSEFKEWFKKRFYTKSTFDFIEEDEDYINTKAAWEEARKGYVSLKKVEDILDLDSVPCPCDASKSGCEHLVCTGYLLKEIKELGNE